MKFNGTYEIAAITQMDEKEEENGDDAQPIIDAAETGLETPEADDAEPTESE